MPYWEVSQMIIQHHPLSKRTEARAGAHSRPFLSLNTSNGVAVTWGPLSTCLSWPTATLDVIPGFKDAVHIFHLSMWTLSAGQRPHLVLHRENMGLPKTGGRGERLCWPPTGLPGGMITTCDFHGVASSSQERKRPVGEITSP